MIDLFDEHLAEGRRAFHTQAALLELLAKTSSSPSSELRHRPERYRPCARA
jgi:hypothetical protein